MAEQLQSSSIQKTLFDETSSYFTRIANSYEAAEQYESMSDLAKFNVRGIAQSTFDLIVQTQMENFKIEG